MSDIFHMCSSPWLYITRRRTLIRALQTNSQFVLVLATSPDCLYASRGLRRDGSCIVHLLHLFLLPLRYCSFVLLFILPSYFGNFPSGRGPGLEESAHLLPTRYRSHFECNATSILRYCQSPMRLPLALTSAFVHSSPSIAWVWRLVMEGVGIARNPALF